jgi:hypothetical protein
MHSHTFKLSDSLLNSLKFFYRPSNLNTIIFSSCQCYSTGTHLMRAVCDHPNTNHRSLLWFFIITSHYQSQLWTQLWSLTTLTIQREIRLLQLVQSKLILILAKTLCALCALPSNRKTLNIPLCP